MRWARGRGCDWNEGTCAYAAQGGHMEILKWLRELTARGRVVQGDPMLNPSRPCSV